MFITKVQIDGEEYKLFGEVTLFPNTKNEVVIDYIAEERLDRKIEEKIEQDLYHKVRGIDEMYGYVVPQEIADTENEDEIRASIEDVYDIED